MKNRFKNLELNKNDNDNDKNNKSIKLLCPACKYSYTLGDNFCNNCGGNFKRINVKTTFNDNTKKNIKNSPSTKATFNKHQVNDNPKQVLKDKKKITFSFIFNNISYSHIYLIFIALLILIAIFKPNWFSLDLFIKY